MLKVQSNRRLLCTFHIELYTFSKGSPEWLQLDLLHHRFRRKFKARDHRLGNACSSHHAITGTIRPELVPDISIGRTRNKRDHANSPLVQLLAQGVRET